MGDIMHGIISRALYSFPFRLALSVFLAGALFPAQKIIENPERPPAKNAGRVLKLAEVWRIEDARDDFFFKYPHSLQNADDGSIFIADDEQLLKFSPDGKFLKNLYKKGQGPGEIEGNLFFFLHGKDVFVQDLNSWRLWRTDQDGVFLEEFNFRGAADRWLLGITPNNEFLFLKRVWPPPNERTGKFMEILHTVIALSRDGRSESQIATFRPRWFLMPQGARSWDIWTSALSQDPALLYVYSGRDYLIEAVDLAAGRIVKRFQRSYPKVPHIEQEWERNFQKKYGAPPIEYDSDIINLHVDGSRLWVETSALDKAKGRLFDVFDAEGRYIDCFFLGAGRTLMNVRNDVLFALEKNEDESFRVVKYKIEV